ncbi:MAG: phosphotransferase [Terracidiphilus sp.]|nr:phosphotransferase [Terracidiphilus sp.]
MKAADLIRNEPFADLFTATLSDFLSLRFGGEWRVAWKKKSTSMTAQSWLVNLNINAIFREGASRHALENTRREYATSVIPWKRPFQRLYFWLATSATPRFIAHAIVEIEPAIPDASQCLIIPSTHKIRFIDAAAGVVYCHLKKGSSAAHFQHEIQARELAASKGVPVPRILERISDLCIAEQMVVGTPLNRLTSRDQRADGLERALHALEPLYRSTARQAKLADYATFILSRIETVAAARKENVSKRALALAKQLVNAICSADRVVELVRSHGDFQPGNILYDQGKIWLIDWEYSSEKQRHYDLLTYTIKVRSPYNLAKRITAFARALPNGLQLWQLRLLLLESIGFESEAVMVASSQYAPRDFIARLAEFEKALPFVLSGARA